MALTTGLQIPYGVQPVNPVPVDSWSGPYEGSTEQDAKALANFSIPSVARFKSMEVRLIVNNVAKKYWYRDGVNDSDLVEFASTVGAGMGSVPVIPDPLRFNFAGNGTTTNFTVSGTNNSNNPLYIDVYVDNVKQISSGVYSLSSEVVKFTDPPKIGSSVVIITPNYRTFGVILNDSSYFTDQATIYL
jgi:hypothetical protein